MTKEQKNSLREWLYITAGILIMTAGIYFFKFPNHFSTGGVTGIAMIINAVTHWPVGVMIILMNVPLFLISWRQKHIILTSLSLMRPLRFFRRMQLVPFSEGLR